MLSQCARSKTRWLAAIPRYRSLSRVIATHGATQVRLASISTKQAVERDTPQKKAPLSKRNNTQEETYHLEKFDPELEFASEELKLLSGGPLAKIGLGDWAEAHRNGKTYSGIVVSQRPIKGGLQMIELMTRSSRVFEFSSDNIPFSLPNFLQLPHIQRLMKTKTDFLRDGARIDDPPMADFRRIAKQFEDRIKFQQATRLAQFGELHQHFIDTESANNELTAQLDDMAKFVFNTERPTDEQLYATHMYVTQDYVHFTATPNVRGSGSFILRKPDEAKNLEWIISSIRSLDDNYKGFLDRCRNAVHFSTQHRDSVTGIVLVGNDKQQFPTFSANDKKYIDFIVEWVTNQKFALLTPHEIFAPAILKALKCYEKVHIEKDVAAQFLRDIGMWQPWDNMTLLEEAPISVEHFWSAKAQENEKIMSRGEKAIEKHILGSTQSSTGSLDPHKPYPNDICDGIRHDFGSLTVYTIDDPSAKEIDDGISVEKFSDHTWVHIHVADPSAYIHPTQELANVMAARVQTLYLPERHFPLLPEGLSSQKFSLVSSSSDAGQYTMSFSAKIDNEGNVIDSKIRPGWVRRICKLSYDQVDSILEGSTPSNDKTALSTLVSISQQHLKQRIAHGAVNFDRPEPSVHLLPYPLDLPSLKFSAPDFQQHAPDINFSVRMGGQSPSRALVTEFMIMAGRIASSTCEERGIPMVYRAQAPPNPELLSTDEQDLIDSVLSQRDPSTGSIQLKEAFRILRFMSPGTVTTQPGCAHWMMGISGGYAKVTSPLRRYLDMVAHWQLKASMLNSPLPFSEDFLKTMGVRVDMREKQLNRLGAKATDWWIAESLRRRQAQGSLATETWDCIISNEAQNMSGRILPASAFIPSLGTNGKMDPSVERSFELGESLKVRVKEIDPMNPRFTIEPVS
ncbi:hypothetical protein INT44_004641 [Umbelopsis vinacea]|uniref:RNB domain-containing protein n=1 Tax=Umbelopsis vinacea TaxID=44442 RepID=A0A8H7QCM8_9FUNG|nr:hypothetical protein INT44_004641 [Umbelopsis vinacea]